jgi:hypothetical protein
MLTDARAESQAHTRQTMAEAGQLVVRTRQSVAGLRAQTGHMLADAAGVMKQLSHASRERAAAWQGILHMLHGNASRSSAAAPKPSVAKAGGRKKSRKVA